jgi:hypothetical protein
VTLSLLKLAHGQPHVTLGVAQLDALLLEHLNIKNYKYMRVIVTWLTYKYTFSCILHLYS